MVPARRNQNWLPSIFNDFLNNDWLMERRNATAPAVNILENDDEYKIEVAAPGMTKEDFKVHINEDNELIISMEKRAEEKEEDKKHKGTYLRREFSYTQFQQSLLLPEIVGVGIGVVMNYDKIIDRDGCRHAPDRSQIIGGVRDGRGALARGFSSLFCALREAILRGAARRIGKKRIFGSAPAGSGGNRKICMP